MFVDEIGEVPLAWQSNAAAALSAVRELQRVGDHDRTVKVDVRASLPATHQARATTAQNGGFRAKPVTYRLALVFAYPALRR